MGLHNFRDLGHLDDMTFVNWEIEPEGMIVLENCQIQGQNGKTKDLMGYGRLLVWIGDFRVFYDRKTKTGLHSRYYARNEHVYEKDLKQIPQHLYIYKEDKIWE
jgi:hypothetical protein